MATTERPCRLYLITPPDPAPADFAPSLAEALDGGDVACVQLRMPDADDGALVRAARTLMPICRARDVAFLVNGHIDVAATLGVDGVHIGRAEGVAEARRRLGAGVIVGVSCGGSRDDAMRAGEAGCDYVSFGALFASKTLPDANIVATDVVSWWSELMVVPCVAVGGLTPANCANAVAAGADFIAVSAAVWNEPKGPGAAVAAFNAAIERTRTTC